MSNMLQTKTAEEILTTVFKPKEFIIDGLLTQGLYVLAGAQKVRKSWLAMDICIYAPFVIAGNKIKDTEEE